MKTLLVVWEAAPLQTIWAAKQTPFPAEIDTHNANRLIKTAVIIKIKTWALVPAGMSLW